MVEAREVASSVVGEKKPVTEGDGVAPCREAWKGKKLVDSHLFCTLLLVSY